MKQIVKAPASVLMSPAKKITSFDKRLLTLCDEMKKTLIATKNPKGVGLAAPQIGEPYAVFVTRPQEKADIRIFINPKVVHTSSEVTDGVPERNNKLEGCLSVPKIWGKVTRAKSLTLEFQDESGKHHTEPFTGFMATIIQHETDHINGILFTQRILEQQGKFYESRRNSEGKEVLEEIDLK